jgi:hypothetical protein
MKFVIYLSIYLSTRDNLMSDRNYTLLMAKLAAAQFEKCFYTIQYRFYLKP